MNLEQLKKLLNDLKKNIDAKATNDLSLFDKVKKRYTKWNTSYNAFQELEKDEQIEVAKDSKEYKEYKLLKMEAEKIIKKLTPKSESKHAGNPKKYPDLERRHTVASNLSSPTSTFPAKQQIIFKSIDDFHKLFETDADKAKELVLQLVNPANTFWGVSALNKVKIGTKHIIDVLTKNLSEDELLKVFEELLKLRDLDTNRNSLFQLMIQNFHMRGCCNTFKTNILTVITEFGDLAAKTAIVGLGSGSRSSTAIMQPIPSEANKRDSVGLELFNTQKLPAAFKKMTRVIFLSDAMPKFLLAILKFIPEEKVKPDTDGKNFIVFAEMIQSMVQSVIDGEPQFRRKYDQQSLLGRMLPTISQLILLKPLYMDNLGEIRADLMKPEPELEQNPGQEQGHKQNPNGFRDKLRDDIERKLKSIFANPEPQANQIVPADMVVAINQLLGQIYALDSSASTSSNGAGRSRFFTRAHSRAGVATTFMGGGSAVPKGIVEKVAAIGKSKTADSSHNPSASDNNSQNHSSSTHSSLSLSK